MERKVINRGRNKISIQSHDRRDKNTSGLFLYSKCSLLPAYLIASSLDNTSLYLKRLNHHRRQVSDGRIYSLYEEPAQQQENKEPKLEMAKDMKEAHARYTDGKNLYG